MIRSALVAALLIGSSARLPCGAAEVREWTDQTGTVKKTGAFERLDGKWVHLKLADGESLKVPLEWLSDPDQAFAKDAAKRGPAGGDEAGAIEVVITEGVGLDVESARKDAYRNAIRQAVGAYVDSETIVENDQLITDKVITLSPAFVERVEPIPGGESKDGSLVRVRVRAHVRITKLLDTLTEGKIKTRAYAQKVDTQSLLAELRTKADQGEAQRDVLQRILADYPEGCLSLTVTGKPSIATAPDGKISLSVPLSLKPNDERYMAFSKQLCTVLSATQRPSGEFSVDGSKFGPDEDRAKEQLKYYGSQALTTSSYLLGIFPDSEQERIKTSCDAQGNSPLAGTGNRYCLWNGDSDRGLDSLRYGTWQRVRTNKRNDWILLCLSGQSKSYQRTDWRWFLVSDDEMKSWFGGLPTAIRCRVSVHDAAGEKLAGDVLKLAGYGTQRLSDKLLFMVPLFVNWHNFTWYTPELTLVRSIAIDEDEAKSIAEVRATIERVTDQR